MGARFAPFSFGGLLLQSYRPHLTQANRTHRTGIPSTSTADFSAQPPFKIAKLIKKRNSHIMIAAETEQRSGRGILPKEHDGMNL